MKANEIKVGGLYLARVSGKIATVRVDAIRTRDGYGSVKDRTVYDVTNLATGRTTTFRSAAKFRCTAKPVPVDPKGVTASEFNAIVDRNMETSEAPVEEASAEADPTPAPIAPPAVSATVSAPAAGLAARIAARIVAARAGRQRGATVAGMVPNDEQEEIISTADEIGRARGCGRVLTICAGAGAGKTATLKMLEQILEGNGQYTAFNTSLVNDAKAKFVKCAVNTTHSLAFRAVGKTYQHRLGGERMRSGQIARILGIEGMVVPMEPFPADSEAYADAAKNAGYTADNPPPADFRPCRLKVISAEKLAGQVVVAVKRFCQTADREIGKEHIGYIDGIDVPTEVTDERGEVVRKMGRENNNRVKEYLAPFLKKAWADLVRVDGVLPFHHDVYVKIWQLGQGNDRPIIAADHILLDEYQDTAPVFLDILMQQKHALLILVGDDNQRIYEWRGAVNAGDYFPDAPRRMLSQSYRFGQTIADVANAVLGTLDEPTELVMRGNPAIPSRVARVAEPRCYLYRTNAGAVGRVMNAIKEGKRPHLIGGGADVVAWCQAAIDLQEKRGTRHPELACFDTWDEVKEYSKTDEGADMRLMVKLVEDFGAIEIRDALKNMPKEADADLVASTAHKSKGREWETVKLGPDFPLANKMGDSDRRLLYVALTRAQLTLDISECPPFCGGKDLGSDIPVPGLVITYTVPMPTEADLAAYTAARDTRPPVAPPAAPRPATNGTVTPAAPAPSGRPGPAGKYTWARHGDAWCVRGPSGAAVGAMVTVERRDGTTAVHKVRGVVKEYADACIYEV